MAGFLRFFYKITPMEKTKEEKDINAFSWPTLFIVTGISFFLFFLILKLVEGQHKSFFLYTGAISFVCGLLAWIGSKPDN
jgi:hypothetical protein